MATKQKQAKNNGAAETAVNETMDYAAMEKAMQQAEQEKARCFMVEYQRLCQEYGLEVWIHAYFDDDGRLRRDRTIRKIAQ